MRGSQSTHKAHTEHSQTYQIKNQSGSVCGVLTNLSKIIQRAFTEHSQTPHKAIKGSSKTHRALTELSQTHQKAHSSATHDKPLLGTHETITKHSKIPHKALKGPSNSTHRPARSSQGSQIARAHSTAKQNQHTAPRKAPHTRYHAMCQTKANT